MTNSEYRAFLLSEIASAYRQIRRLERKLAKPPFTRVFKDPQCKTAERIAELRSEIVSDMQDENRRMIKAWSSLPEVQSGGEITGLSMLNFAKKLAMRKATPRYLKNQTVFPQ